MQRCPSKEGSGKSTWCTTIIEFTTSKCDRNSIQYAKLNYVIQSIFECDNHFMNIKNQLSTRVRNSCEQKKRWISAVSAGVSPEGQKLYMAIAKTINQVSPIEFNQSASTHFSGIKWIMCISMFCGKLLQVIWRGPNIVVFNDVTIKPPYKAEDVNGNPDSRQLKYVRKIVEKFLSDQADPDESSTTWNKLYLNFQTIKQVKKRKKEMLKTVKHIVCRIFWHCNKFVAEWMRTEY